MITRITAENANKYKALFLEAIEALKEKGTITLDSQYEVIKLTQDNFNDYLGEIYVKVGEEYSLVEPDALFDESEKYYLLIPIENSITSIEEYFTYIKDLEEIDRKFTILPRDEDFFEINANTRAIKIPENFSRYGVSVQGDEIAEILYFTIDRFYDMDDLLEKNVFIQWRTPSATGKESIEGTSEPWIVNGTVIPGKIIIGWAISSKLTAVPGKIDFAVRFYNVNPEDEKRLSYSFSTTTSSVEIKPSLNYDLNKIMGENLVDNPSQIIKDRLVNSTLASSNIPAPVLPVVVDENIYLVENNKITEVLADYDKYVDDAGKEYYEIYLTDANGVEKDAVYLVQGTSSDSGLISYVWNKKDVNGNYLEEMDVRDYFKITDDTERDINKVYYEFKELDNVYTPYAFSGEETWDVIKVMLYEKFKGVIINSSGADVLGKYMVRVNNRTGRQVATTYGVPAYVNPPIRPQFIENKNLSEVVLMPYFSDESNTLSVSYSHTADENAHVKYEWYYSEDGNENNYFLAENVDFENPTQKGVEYTANAIIMGNDYQDEDPSEGYGDGYYKVNIITRLNATEENIMSEPIRVTHTPLPLVITKSIATLPELNKYDITKPVEITIKVDEKEHFISEKDTIKCQWYKYNGTASNLAQAIDDAEKGIYKVGATDSLIKEASVILSPEEGIEQSEFKYSIKLPNVLGSNTDGGYYYCQVKNCYNGYTSAEPQCSGFFEVIDSEE